MTDTSSLTVLVPAAEPILEIANSLMPPERRLTAPAHITLVYPFMPPHELTSSAFAELSAFFSTKRRLAFELTPGSFGREVLLLRPEPASALIDLTEAIVERWPEYPYYGGTYDTIEPHLSLAFGTAEELAPIAALLPSRMPIRVQIEEVTLVVGPDTQMRPGPTFRLATW